MGNVRFLRRLRMAADIGAFRHNRREIRILQFHLKLIGRNGKLVDPGLPEFMHLRYAQRQAAHRAQRPPLLTAECNQAAMFFPHTNTQPVEPVIDYRAVTARPYRRQEDPTFLNPKKPLEKNGFFRIFEINASDPIPVPDFLKFSYSP